VKFAENPLPLLPSPIGEGSKGRGLRGWGGALVIAKESWGQTRISPLKHNFFPDFFRRNISDFLPVDFFFTRSEWH